MYVNKWYVRALYVYGGVIMPVHLYMEVKGGHGGSSCITFFCSVHLRQVSCGTWS